MISHVNPPELMYIRAVIASIPVRNLPLVAASMSAPNAQSAPSPAEEAPMTTETIQAMEVADMTRRAVARLEIAA